MIDLKRSKGCAPERKRPLMKKAGVPRAPILLPMAASASTCSASFLSSMAALNLVMLRPISLAYFSRSSAPEPAGS